VCVCACVRVCVPAYRLVRQSDIWSVGCCLLEMLTAQEVLYVYVCM
jgi:hypothetical protein